MGVDRLRERVGRSLKKAEGIGAHGMSAAALGSRGEALARGSVEGCRVAALYRGSGASSPRQRVNRDWDRGRPCAPAQYRCRAAALYRGFRGEQPQVVRKEKV